MLNILSQLAGIIALVLILLGYRFQRAREQVTHLSRRQKIASDLTGNTGYIYRQTLFKNLNILDRLIGKPFSRRSLSFSLGIALFILSLFLHYYGW